MVASGHSGFKRLYRATGFLDASLVHVRIALHLAAVPPRRLSVELHLLDKAAVDPAPAALALVPFP